MCKFKQKNKKRKSTFRFIVFCFIYNFYFTREEERFEPSVAAVNVAFSYQKCWNGTEVQAIDI